MIDTSTTKGTDLTKITLSKGNQTKEEHILDDSTYIKF